MSWFSKTFKRVTKEISRTANRVAKEANRAASKVSAVLNTIPIPIGPVAGGAIGAAGALLAGKSASKYLKAIPENTLSSLIRGAELAATGDVAGALDSMVNTVATAQEKFVPQFGKVPIRELTSAYRSFLNTGGLSDGIAGLGSIALNGSAGGLLGGQGNPRDGAFGGGQYAAAGSGGAPLPVSSVLGSAGGSLQSLLVNGTGGPSGRSGGSLSSVRILLDSAGSLAGLNLRW